MHVFAKDRRGNYLKVGDYAEKIIAWYTYLTQGKIEMVHAGDDLFRVTYTEDDVLYDEEIIADPDDDGNYPLELVINGVVKKYTVWGEPVD